MDRNALLAEIEAGRARLEAALRARTPAEMEERVNGDWTRRDVVAHLEAWERRVVSLYAALRAGNDPGSGEETDALNARFFEESRSRPLGEILRGEAEAYGALLDLVRTAPEADLFAPDRFAWTGDSSFFHWIVGNSSGHYEEHLDQLEAVRA